MTDPFTDTDLDMGDTLLDPVAACDRLWTPPSRATGGVS